MWSIPLDPYNLPHIDQVGIWDFVELLAKFNPTRLQTDPLGYAKDVAGMVSGELPLVGLGPDGGPGVAESWKALGKACLAAGQQPAAAEAWRSGMAAATQRGDKQAEKEMAVFLRRLG